MSTGTAIVESKEPPVQPIVKLRGQFEEREAEFSRALPEHIPVARFTRVVMTAIQRNPDLVTADRQSLFNSSLLAAQDGLLTDGREGALVIYKTKIKRNGTETWGQMVQWMPMIAGILKKARNSGEISTLEAHLVHQNDQFSFRIGVDDMPQHEPDWFGDRGRVIGVYAFAKLKDGAIMSEIMSVEQVEQVRSASRAKDSGPWVQWWGEMARKTVLRRLSKRLPTSSDLDDLIRRDDALYDFDGARDEGRKAKGGSLADRMQALTAPAKPAPAQIEHAPNSLDGRMTDLRDRLPSTDQANADPETGETSNSDRGSPTAKDTETKGDVGHASAGGSVSDLTPHQEGRAAYHGGGTDGDCPAYRNKADRDDWIAGFRDAASENNDSFPGDRA